MEKTNNLTGAYLRSIEVKYFSKYIEKIDEVFLSLLKREHEYYSARYNTKTMGISSSNEENNSHGYVPINVKHILSLVCFCNFILKQKQQASTKKGVESLSIADLGCGTGRVLKYLDFFKKDYSSDIGLFNTIRGYELQTSLVAVGRNEYNVDIEQKNILKLTRDDIWPYDILYMYEPVTESDAKKLVNKLSKIMIKNQYIYLIPSGDIKKHLLQSNDFEIILNTEDVFICIKL